MQIELAPKPSRFMIFGSFVEFIINFEVETQWSLEASPPKMYIVGAMRKQNIFFVLEDTFNLI